MQTELQRLEELRKESMRIRSGKGRARRRTKKLQVEKKRLSETEDHEKQLRDTLKKLKKCDENELETRLILENIVTSKLLRVAVETNEERRARLENDAATKWLRLAMHETRLDLVFIRQIIEEQNIALITD